MQDHEVPRSVIWRPGEPSVSSSLRLKGWELAEPKAYAPVHIQRQKKTNVPSQDHQVERVNSLSLNILFYSGFQQIGWSLPTSGKAICFTQSNDLNVNFIQEHPHKHTQSNLSPNIWAPCGPVKLTHKINHHNWYAKRGKKMESYKMLNKN